MSLTSILLLVGIGIPVALVFAIRQIHKYMSGGVCRCTSRLDGKTVIVTGANTGIGKETAKNLVQRGAKVILACRNTVKGLKALKEIQQESLCPPENCIVRDLDLSSLESVRKFASQILREESQLHILVNNAGVMMTPYSKTVDGLELQMGTNHFGHFLLTLLLLDLIKASSPSRIINLSSLAHEYGKIDFDDINCEKKFYNSGLAYSASKLANVLFTRELAKRLAEPYVTVNAVHPGVVNTELMRYSSIMSFMHKIMTPVRWIFEKSAVQGAQTSIHVAVCPDLQGVSGQYFSDCKVKRPGKNALDDEVAKKLWDLSAKITGVK